MPRRPLSTNASRTHLRAHYLTRQVHYLYGTADLDAEDQGCAAKTQGAGDYERGQFFWRHITESYPGPWVDSIQRAYRICRRGWA
jgi:hypothetical protein